MLATGDGDKIMQFCPSFHIVQLIRRGCSPQQACEEVVTAMRQGSDMYFEVGVIALDCKVRYCQICAISPRMSKTKLLLASKLQQLSYT